MPDQCPGAAGGLADIGKTGKSGAKHLIYSIYSRLWSSHSRQEPLSPRRGINRRVDCDMALSHKGKMPRQVIRTVQVNIGLEI